MILSKEGAEYLKNDAFLPFFITCENFYYLGERFNRRGCSNEFEWRFCYFTCIKNVLESIEEYSDRKLVNYVNENLIKEKSNS